jgi:hypothetical protein
MTHPIKTLEFIQQPIKKNPLQNMKFGVVLALVFVLFIISSVASYEFEDYTALSREFSLRDESETLAYLESADDNEAVSVFSDDNAVETLRPLGFKTLEVDQPEVLDYQNDVRGDNSVDNTSTQSKAPVQSVKTVLTKETPLVLTS